MEQWICHNSCKARETNTIMGSWPLIKILHQKFPEDCIFVDLERVRLLFDEDGVPIQERFDSDNEFWTVDNPLPVNSIADNQEVLELWNDPVFKPGETLFRQTQEDVEWMMKIREQNPKTTILVIGQSVTTVKAWDTMDELVIRLQGFTNRFGSPNYIPEKKNILTPIITCFMIQTFGEAPPTDQPQPVILTTMPNMKYNWYCRHCAKIFPKNQCSRCRSELNPDDPLAKPGTWYCNKECQKADWKRHKKECKSIAE